MIERLYGDPLIVASRELVDCDLHGETAILNLETEVYYGLDEIGTRIWNLIRQPRRLSEIRTALLEEYDVDPEECDTCVRRFLESLQEAGLVTATEAPLVAASSATV